MAFAIASGAPPEAGLYTAVVAGFAISALGGSRNQIGGPTGAFVVIISGILARYGFNGLLICTIMAGVLLILLGATGLGAAVKFIPRPVIVGFTNGIAILIASTQIKDFFGLRTGPVPGDFVGRMRVVLEQCAYRLADHYAAGRRLAAADRGDPLAGCRGCPATSWPWSRLPSPSTSCTCRWRPWARASGESLPAFLVSMFRSSNTAQSGC